MADRRGLAVALPTVAACAVLLVVAAAARSGTPLAATVSPVSPIRLHLGKISGHKPPTGHAPEFNLPGAGSLLWVALAFVALLVAVLLFGLLVLLKGLLVRPAGIARGQRGADAPAVPDGAAAASDEQRRRLRGEVEAGLEDLDDAGDPRRAVIACWLRLERAASEAGTPRRSAETPGDLVTRVLAEHRVGAGPLQELSALYREARYSRHELDDGVRRQARAALDDVRRELGAEVPA